MILLHAYLMTHILTLKFVMSCDVIDVVSEPQ